MKITIESLVTITNQQASEISSLSLQLGYKTDEKFTFTNISNILLNKENCIYVAILNNEIIGWIHAFYAIRVETDSFVEIAGLVVHENYRQQKIGKRLIQAVNQWSKNFNTDQLRVRCNEIRIASHNFYERLGFILNKKQFVFEIKNNQSYK